MMIVVCYLVLSHVPSVHGFDSITPHFFNHMSDTSVLENNKVMLSKS
jgi:hypothetical protein